MKKLSLEQQNKLIHMLLEDESFTKIRKALNLGERYNIKNLCEYYGGKLYKAYNLHINNYRKEYKLVEHSPILTKDEFYKTIQMLSTQLQQQDLITNNEEIVINVLPKTLPCRLQGENYKIKQTSIKIIDNVYNEFTQYCKQKKNHYSSIELHSLALLEFLEKYRI